MRHRHLFVSTAALTLLWAGAVTAQQATQQPAQGTIQSPQATTQPAATQAQQPTTMPAATTAQPAQQRTAARQAGAGQPQMAERCLADLRAFDEEVIRSGYGLIGPRGYGFEEPLAPAAGATAASPVGQPAAVGPRREMRTLYEAAMIFARNGDERACQMILSELRETYSARMQRIQAAGLDPAEVRTWRHERLLQAQPVGEMQRVVHIDDILRTEVRNLQDERLGSVEDVILNPENGAISYVLVGRGGFFGIGRSYVAVPWQRLKASADLDTFVLDVPRAALDEAPTVDRNAFSERGRFGEQRRTVDQYWDRALRG